MRAGGPALELRVSLGADEERVDVGGQLDELDQRTVGQRPADHEAGGDQPVAIGVVDLVAVPVPLRDLAHAVGRAAPTLPASSAG
jgi:hypothetical protein